MTDHTPTREKIVQGHKDIQSLVLVPFLFPYRTDHISIVQPTNRTGFVTVIRSSYDLYDQAILFAKQLGYKDSHIRVSMVTGMSASEKIACIRKLISTASNPVVYPNLFADLYESRIHEAKNLLLNAMSEF